MAEATAGLVIGAVGLVALASLFQTCKAGFDTVQTGLTFARDCNVVETKYEAQKLRFMIWGQAVGLVGELPYDQNLDDPNIRPPIERVLNTLQSLFSDTDRLRKKYGMKPIGSVTGAAHLPESFQQLQLRIRNTQREASTTAKAKWALSKKALFEKLVIDVKDLVDVLKAITTSMQMLSRRREILEAEIESADGYSLRILQEVASETNVQISDVASRRLLLLDGDESSDMYGPGPGAADSAEGASVASTYATAKTRQSLPADQSLSETQVLTEKPPGDDADGHESTLDSGPVASTSRKHHGSADGDDSSPSTVPPESNEAYSAAELEDQDRKMWDLHQSNIEETRQTLLAPSPPSCPKRVLREVRVATLISYPSFVSLVPIDGNIMDLLGSLQGPSDSNYQGGIFFVRVHMPNAYPLAPPRVKFLTKVYHPNIDAQGRVCLNILDKGWSPGLTTEKVLLSLLVLLDEPNPDDPLVPEISQQYRRDRQRFSELARLYTRRYATGERPEIPPIDPANPWWDSAKVIIEHNPPPGRGEEATERNHMMNRIPAANRPL